MRSEGIVPRSADGPSQLAAGLRHAGQPPDLFTAAAIAALHDGGVGRPDALRTVIGLATFLALLEGCARVDAAHVEAALRCHADLDVQEPLGAIADQPPDRRAGVGPRGRSLAAAAAVGLGVLLSPAREPIGRVPATDPGAGRQAARLMVVAEGSGRSALMMPAPDPATAAPAPRVGAATPPMPEGWTPPPAVATMPEAPGLTGGAGLALVAGPGDTMPTLYARIYRGMVPPPYAKVVGLNQVVVKPGSIVVFPAPPDGWP